MASARSAAAFVVQQLWKVTFIAAAQRLHMEKVSSTAGDLRRALNGVALLPETQQFPHQVQVGAGTAERFLRQRIIYATGRFPPSPRAAGENGAQSAGR